MTHFLSLPIPTYIVEVLECGTTNLMPLSVLVISKTLLEKEKKYKELMPVLIKKNVKAGHCKYY